MVWTSPKLTIRVAMKALAAVVATVDFNDLRTDLKEGVIDGQENPVAVIYVNRL
jgi:TRAP-type C4-dicarboxylate transport system substrate-binding protein